MSLVGNLEDLGLGDILQIVSLSRKSGILRLKQESRTGAIIFRSGLVVSAMTSDERPELAQVLVGAGVLTAAQRDDVLQVWTDAERRESLAALIGRQFHISGEQIQTAIRQVVERVVYGFFGWTEGTFHFELKEVEEELSGFGPEAAQFALDSGINPQFLAMEGSRILDEARAGISQAAPPKASAAPPPPAAPPAPTRSPAPQKAPVAEAPPAPRSAPPAEPATGGGGKKLVLIDDDALTLAVLEKSLSSEGFSVLPCQGSKQGLAQIASLQQSGSSFLVLADLLMPRSDEAGILGGIEILERIRADRVSVPVMLLTDYENDEARKKAEALGVDAFLRKPRKSQLSREEDTPELKVFLSEVRPILKKWGGEPAGAGPVPGPAPKALQAAPPSPALLPAEPPPLAPAAPKTPSLPPKPAAPIAAAPHNGAKDGMVDIRGELAKEFEDDFFSSGTGPAAFAVVPSRGLAMLRAMTNELNDPNSNVEITLLVLRFAAELMSRAVIFVATPEDFRGLGEFGVELKDDNSLKRVRRMRIPLAEPSFLRDAYERQTVVKAPPVPTKWNRYIIGQLGGGVPLEAFVAPVVSSGKVVALLYGDNIPEQREIGDTESLEIFLVQAGMAMDRALLTRKLKEAVRRPD